MSSNLEEFAGGWVGVGVGRRVPACQAGGAAWVKVWRWGRDLDWVPVAGAQGVCGREAGEERKGAGASGGFWRGPTMGAGQWLAG